MKRSGQNFVPLVVLVGSNLKVSNNKDGTSCYTNPPKEKHDLWNIENQPSFKPVQTKLDLSKAFVKSL